MENNCTILITKDKAIDLIVSQLNRKTYEEMDSNLLSKLLGELGYGRDKNLPYYRTNIKIIND